MGKVSGMRFKVSESYSAGGEASLCLTFFTQSDGAALRVRKILEDINLGTNDLGKGQQRGTPQFHVIGREVRVEIPYRYVERAGANVASLTDRIGRDMDATIANYKQALPGFDERAASTVAIAHSIEPEGWRTFRLGKDGEVYEGDLDETMQGYANLFSTGYPEDASKARDRFLQIFEQLREDVRPEYADRFAEVIVREIEKIAVRPGGEPCLEDAFFVLERLGSSNAVPFLLSLIRQEGDDEQMLYKREMAAETLVSLPDPTIPDNLAEIARGKDVYSRSQRRVAVWALGHLAGTHPQTTETLRALRGDPEVDDLIHIT